MKNNTKESVREIAFEVLKLYKQEEKNNVKKARFRNTGLLLNHYIDFVDHYENIKYKASDIQNELDLIESKMIEIDDIYIQSIKRSKIRTKIIVHHIEAAIDMLKSKMKNKNEPEKYDIIERLYMDRNIIDMKFNARIKFVSDSCNCSESSARRWNSEMLNELSVLLFGVDGLRLEL